MITTTNNNLCKLMQARHLIVWKYILECSLLSERLFMCYQTWPSPYKFQSKLGLAMNQQKKLRTTMINFLSLSSIKPFPHVSTEFIFSYANLITCHEGHSQPSTVWKKKSEANTVSVMHETGRNMHLYSDICSQANCTYRNEHASAILSNCHLNEQNCLY